jgi:hypothetical protein
LRNAIGSRDIRIPADPQDYETTESRSALPPVEFSIAVNPTLAPLNTFRIKDRQYPAQRAPTVSYRIYFLPSQFAPSGLSPTKLRAAGQKVAYFVADVKAPGRGTDLTVTDIQFSGTPGYYYCVGVSRRDQEAPAEHFVKAP